MAAKPKIKNIWLDVETMELRLFWDNGRGHITKISPPYSPEEVCETLLAEVRAIHDDHTLMPRPITIGNIGLGGKFKVVDPKLPHYADIIFKVKSIGMLNTIATCKDERFLFKNSILVEKVE